MSLLNALVFFSFQIYLNTTENLYNVMMKCNQTKFSKLFLNEGIFKNTFVTFMKTCITKNIRMIMK